jgi:hypothetical protein
MSHFRNMEKANKLMKEYDILWNRVNAMKKTDPANPAIKELEEKMDALYWEASALEDYGD